jgi:hypothetical protein
MLYATSLFNSFSIVSQISYLPFLTTFIYPSQIALEISPPLSPLANSAADIIHIF